MSAPERVLRRVRGVVGTAGIEQLNPAGVRLTLRELLFDGESVPSWHAAASCREVGAEPFFATAARMPRGSSRAPSGSAEAARYGRRAWPTS